MKVYNGVFTKGGLGAAVICYHFFPSVIARNEAIPDYTEQTCTVAAYLMVSLFAKKSLFVLIQKVTKKIKTTSMLPRSLPVLHAFFAVRYFVTLHHTKS
jgi:hypothetical protein